METPLATQTVDTVAIARDYFERVDQGRTDLGDLFTDDVQIFFPKFGIRRGKSALDELIGGLMKQFDAAEHDFSDYLFMPSGNHLAVEGTTSGRMKSGETWRGGATPGGRFCNIFEFRDGLIARLHVYLDPDYVGQDKPRFLWGETGISW